MKVLLDTCVVIDVLQGRQPFCDSAQSVFLSAASEQFEGFLTAKSTADIYYLTHRLTHSDSETKDILLKLFSLFQLLDTSGADCCNAISSKTSDYEDAIMVETAKRTGMNCILTRNTPDYRYSSVPVYTPDEFLKILAAENS